MASHLEIESLEDYVNLVCLWLLIILGAKKIFPLCLELVVNADKWRNIRKPAPHRWDKASMMILVVMTGLNSDLIKYKKPADYFHDYTGRRSLLNKVSSQRMYNNSLRLICMFPEITCRPSLFWKYHALYNLLELETAWPSIVPTAIEISTFHCTVKCT